MREQSRPRHLSLHNNGHVNNIQRNWTCGTPRSCAQCALSIANAPICRGTGSEAPPTFRAWTAGTCRAWSQRRQPPRKVKLPIICTPHWAGGEPNWAVSPGVVGADHPSVGTATPTPHVPPTNATVVLAVSQSDRERDGHLHQLFHHLRLGKRGARRGMAHEEPGHPGGLPGLPAVSPPSAARRCGREGQPARSRRSAPRCAAKRVPAEQTQQTACLAATRRQAHLRHQGKRTQCLPPGGWDAPERGRVALLDPTPWPLPSSVSVELSGAFSANAMRTVCCSYLYHERSRRSLRRCAAPITGCQKVSAMNYRSTVHRRQRATCLLLLLMLSLLLLLNGYITLQE